jgi:hypothetical protein
MCDCISQIDKKLAPEHQLDIAIRYTGGTLIATPNIRIMRKDNGKHESRRGKPSIFGCTYCPFCGQPYENQPAKPATSAELIALGDDPRVAASVDIQGGGRHA